MCIAPGETGGTIIAVRPRDPGWGRMWLERTLTNGSFSFKRRWHAILPQPKPFSAMGAYKQILYQIVFGTLHREPTLAAPHQEELYKYISGVVAKHKGKLYRINGMEDHLHIVSDLHPAVSLANYVKDIKLASNDWMKRSGLFPSFTGWQEAYGAFTYSIKERDTLIDYVKNQKEHHKHESFYDEFKRLLIEQGVLFDEKYLL